MKIKLATIFLSLIFFSACKTSQQLPAVLTDQFDAFNKGDIPRLVNNVTDDFKWFYITPDTILLEVAGKENFKTSMEGYFGSGIKVSSKIESFSIEGNRISFKEVVSYKNKKGELVTASSMGAYEIKEGKIFRTWYFID